jgi:hypothetical protein
MRSQEHWAFVPGPTALAHPIDSQAVMDLELYAPAAVAESFLSYPGMRLLSAATPDWWHWRARWDSGGDFIEVGMTLFDDPAQSWGGSAISADCTVQAIEALWLHLQSRHAAIWLHADDCTIHTPESFRTTMGASGA